MSKSLPMVSVIMPLLDVASGERLVWFTQAIKSIVNQDYKGVIELVLVDDGSTDSTPKVVLLLKEELENPRRVFLYLRIPHLGITRALNHGLGRANGELIARLDSDDWSVPSRISKQVEFLQQNPDIALVGTPVRIVRGTRVTEEIWNRPTDHETLVKELRNKNRIAHSSVMFRKSVIESVGDYNTEFPYAQDWEFWWRISQKYRIAQLPETLTYYRIHSKQISSDHRKCQQDQAAHRIKRLINLGEKR